MNLVLSLDIMDESGEHVTDYVHQVYKERLDPKGNVIEKQELQGDKNDDK
jgi:hypothetical protein